MEGQAPPRRFGRRIERRIERKGFRPSAAASVIVAFWAVGVVVFGVVERLVDPSTFDNVWIAMWWAIQTVTTVGYGDIVPGGTAGKVIASFLMLGGLSLFAVVTGAITSAFVAQAQAAGREEGQKEDPVTQRLEEITMQLESIKAELARLNAPQTD
jgi:voltage-gated potassium channel